MITAIQKTQTVVSFKAHQGYKADEEFSALRSLADIYKPDSMARNRLSKVKNQLRQVEELLKEAPVKFEQDIKNIRDTITPDSYNLPVKGINKVADVVERDLYHLSQKIKHSSLDKELKDKIDAILNPDTGRRKPGLNIIV